MLDGENICSSGHGDGTFEGRNLCRICKSKAIKKVGDFRPYIEYTYKVYDCNDCGCRYVWREQEVHESLHSSPQSPYAFQSILSSEVEKYFQIGDRDKLYDLLSKIPKYKFVMDKISEMTMHNMSILEIGCSQGYLTAYFITCGYDITGMDISATAINKAKSNFGDYFQVIGDDLSHIGNFDVIYHTGTIGCVNDPIKFTSCLLENLKPNGKLLFNAPNVEAVLEMNKIWATTPPPDLITLFTESFWHKYFQNRADIEVTYEPYDHKSNLAKNLSKLLKKTSVNKELASLYESSTIQEDGLLDKVKRIFLKLASILTKNFLYKYFEEYGMFVSIHPSSKGGMK